MSKQKIKIFFTDFWQNFDIENNIFVNLLKDNYNIEITDKPDYLFFSIFGNQVHKFNCTRIFFTGENIKPDFKICDYSFSFDFDDYNGRNYRLPQYYQYGDMNELLKEKDFEQILKQKTKFCNFIYSNPKCKKRNNFFKKLSKYKKVDSAGRYLNNIGRFIGPKAEDKWEFMKPYKFTIAFENEEADYYTTEKIYEAMKVNSLPIYWGNPKIGLDFNTKSFLNYYDFNNDEELIEKIIEIDKNDDLYFQYLKEPNFVNNELNQFVKKENILNQFDRIFKNDIVTVSSKSKVFSKNNFERRFAILNHELKYRKFILKRRIKLFHPAKILMKFIG
ncbi:glycosyltransferase [Bacteroidetes/Chlorobi group bacterium ChocPot_Mid]|nr:MAG: glycosyltransferase [Bacteroidetes/Chlorobi group bacterium ChocPot_Mid]